MSHACLGQTVPLVRRLEGYGKLLCLIMGTFLEGNKDLHSLLEILADSKFRARGLVRGREGTEQERSVILLNIRRELNMAGARAHFACLLGRVARLGEGHRLAAKRRAWVLRENEPREVASRAHWTANISGRGIIRGGREFIVQ